VVISVAGKEQPTVVSPDIYKRRFLDAMDRYFLLVPDRWVGFAQGVDCSIVRPTTSNPSYDQKTG